MNSRLLYSVFIYALLFAPFILRAQSSDSTIVASNNTKTYVVAKGETISGIAKDHHCTVAQLKALNPSLNEKTLRYGVKIKIPSNASKPLTNTGGAVVKTLTETSVSSDVKSAPGFSITYHVVQQDETLFKIATHYHQSVANIRQWNHLVNDNVVVGKKIIVGKTKIATASDSPTFTTAVVTQPATAAVTSTATSSANLLENIQKGMARWDKGTVSNLDGKLLYGLCSMIPVGTIVKVTNMINGQYVIVKITGKLNDNDDGVLIKIPETAAQQLNATGNECMVQLSYFVSMP